MDEASSLPVTDPVHPRQNRRRQQLTILIACVLIATALWLLRAFENEYTTRVDHPVRFVNLPENMVSVNPLPQRISLEVRGLGFSVLKHNWNFSKTPLTIDIRNLKSSPSQTKKKGFVEHLALEQYISIFSSQLKDLEVTAIFPDTITFNFAIKKSKSIKVIPVISYDSEGFIIPDSLITVNPDSIRVEGPDLILDTLSGIRTLPIKINRPMAGFTRSIGLEEINRLVKLSISKVTVSTGKKP